MDPQNFTSIEPKVVDIAAYREAGYPDLLRGMIVTVHRPGGFSFNPQELFWRWVAWRIRTYSAMLLELLGIPFDQVTEHHSMIYAGGGLCISQDSELDLVHLSKYTGCVLTFWDRLSCWQKGKTGINQRSLFVNECIVNNRGRQYAPGDLHALANWAATGERQHDMEDPEHWICSEMVCVLYKKWVLAGYCGGGEDCLITPHGQALWMQAHSFIPIARLRIG